MKLKKILQSDYCYIVLVSHKDCYNLGVAIANDQDIFYVPLGHKNIQFIQNFDKYALIDMFEQTNCYFIGYDLKKIYRYLFFISRLRIKFHTDYMIVDKLANKNICKDNIIVNDEFDVDEAVERWFLNEIPKYKNYNIIISDKLNKLEHKVLPVLADIECAGCCGIFPYYNQINVTGRMYTHNPNIQGFTKKKIDDLFTKYDSPGNNIYSFDFKELEMRIIANLSGDDALIKIISNTDIHKYIAKKFLSSDDRNEGKKFNYSLLYGVSVKNLTKVFRLSYNEMNDIIKRYFNVFSKLKLFFDNLEKQKELMSIAGRYLKTDYIPQKRNFIIQATAADIFKLQLIRLSKVKGIKILLLKHDEYIINLNDNVSPDDIACLLEYKSIKWQIPLKIKYQKLF